MTKNRNVMVEGRRCHSLKIDGNFDSMYSHDWSWTENLHIIWHSLSDEVGFKIMKRLLWSSGKGQARMSKGWPARRKASKLKPLPRAYIKVGRHPPNSFIIPLFSTLRLTNWHTSLRLPGLLRWQIRIRNAAPVWYQLLPVRSRHMYIVYQRLIQYTIYQNYCLHKQIRWIAPVHSLHFLKILGATPYQEYLHVERWIKTNWFDISPHPVHNAVTTAW